MSACMHAWMHSYTGFFQVGLSRVRVWSTYDLGCESWSENTELSLTDRYCVEMAKYIIRLFSLSGRPTILILSTQRYDSFLMGTP